MTVRLLFLFFLAAGLTTLRGAPALPLQNGEQLTYRVSWAVVGGAGEIKINAQQDPMHADRLILTTTTGTRGFARWLLYFEARADSIFDRNTGRLLSLHETNTKRAETSAHTVTFDYANREAAYTELKNGDSTRALKIPPGNPTDLIMGLLQTRTWDLKPGEKRDALVLFDDDFYELTLHALRYEEVKTPMGKFNTLVLEPRMDKTAPKGMFKKGSTVRVWIAQDKHRLPVRFEVEFKIGTGTATLEHYRPPPAAAPDAKNSGS